ncbi:sel1 repeat family protein [Burkholderia vietnamiensis]|uniref:SEL1-like repeat protein n=1 Tax=Burkholderia vietnamiensis TaxID=60552 RepID=UPI0018C58D95|nr:sel1 repeat family protein [Burkholderia vietnamiensis]
MNRYAIIIGLALVASACSKKETPGTALPDMSAVRTNLAFSCTHQADHLPPLDPQAEGLFLYARFLEKQDGPKDFNEVARYYRIAAAHGHYKANQNLQSLISDGLADSPDAPKETVELAVRLIKQGIPSGYYDIGHYLETGYGLGQDAETALRYFRKAADLGNPEAQAYVGELLAPHDKAPDIALQMRECAMDQGLPDVASTLGIHYQESSQFPKAIRAFQKGVESGDKLSAWNLAHSFQQPLKVGEPYYLGVATDSERTRRYQLITKFIENNDGRNPKLPDIDKIVPLPPAKLPPWDGTFEWQKEQDAAVPPKKPSEATIDAMAKAYNLDPKTGFPL